MSQCECEHNKHFDESLNAHKYGVECETYPVKTDYGVFHVCRECSDTCLALYKHNAMQYRTVRP